MENSYDFSNKKRGLAYIIVNKNFKERTHITLTEEEPVKYTERNGAEKDYENMKKVFKLLGFKLFPFKDQTAKGIEDILTKASQRKDLYERQSFACVISSHGGERSVGVVRGKTAKNEHYIVGSDSQTVETRTLIDMFSSSNCPGLKNTPKLFFIQACRGNKDEVEIYDDGVEVDVASSSEDCRRCLLYLMKRMGIAHWLEVSSTSSSEYIIDTTDDESDGDDEYRNKTKPVLCATDRAMSSTESGGRDPMESDTDPGQRRKDDRVDTDIPSEAYEEVLECPCHEDMIVMFAAPSGKYSWRSTTYGSWLLFHLYSEVLEHTRKDDIENTDFLSLLIKVTGRVSSMVSNTREAISNEKKIVPVINHKLLKDLYFAGIKWNVFKRKRKEKKIIWW